MKYSLEHYRRLYQSQKSNAKRRGIDFLLTFQEWTNFWGSDVDRRGCGSCDLQMQRIADTGPYALWNIKKGTPKENAKTAWKMRKKRNCEAANKELQGNLDSMMFEPSKEDQDDVDDDEKALKKLGYNQSRYLFGHYAIDS